MLHVSEIVDVRPVLLSDFNALKLAVCKDFIGCATIQCLAISVNIQVVAVINRLLDNPNVSFFFHSGLVLIERGTQWAFLPRSIAAKAVICLLIADEFRLRVVGECRIL